jgi:hypothetical protein
MAYLDEDDFCLIIVGRGRKAAVRHEKEMESGHSRAVGPRDVHLLARVGLASAVKANLEVRVLLVARNG